MEKFWIGKTLAQLTSAQWEALCDGCGRCCLQKLKNPTTGKVYYTWVACFLLDTKTCYCKDYDQRHSIVPDCLELKPDTILKLRWLPKTCAYRRVAEGNPLPDWHPLITGTPDSVRTAGIAICHRAVSEEHVHPDDLENFIIKEKF
ncbi:MAG: YcgN family cysteine cluster protein [Desulfatitalea sp.]|nr:YcgN family cysteine cluster protein [Desulfatitalea sp.]NNJ99918.1 YcgN family cysteine cluster protein [Desulfatitalea sp.]